MRKLRKFLLAPIPILAYASVIDNESGDSIFVVPSADQGTTLP